MIVSHPNYSSKIYQDWFFDEPMPWTQIQNLLFLYTNASDAELWWRWALFLSNHNQWEYLIKIIVLPWWCLTLPITVPITKPISSFSSKTKPIIKGINETLDLVSEPIYDIKNPIQVLSTQKKKEEEVLLSENHQPEAHKDVSLRNPLLRGRCSLPAAISGKAHLQSINPEEWFTGTKVLKRFKTSGFKDKIWT